jgi:hypothetical protein
VTEIFDRRIVSTPITSGHFSRRSEFDFPQAMLVESQQNACLAVIDKLFTYSISQLFADFPEPSPSSPEGQCPGPKRLGLNDIRRKLLNNEYSSVAAWRDDIERIWSISLSINSKGTVLGNITCEIQNHFRKYSQHLTDNLELDWLNKLCALRDELNSIQRKAGSGKGQPLGRSQSQPKPSLEKQKHPKKHQIPFTKPDLVKLTQDITALRDPIHILMVFEILEKHEPSVKPGMERLEIDCSTLKTGTLHALRDKIDQWLAQ